MIHQYKLNGYNIVLDIFSGSVHAVDEVAYDMIQLYEINDKGAIIYDENGDIKSTILMWKE